MALAARQVDLVVIGNGLRPWEQDLVRRAGGRYLALPSLGGAMVPHGVVLRLLLEEVGRPFGLHDPDLFVFRPALYTDLEPAGGEVASGVYGFTNPKTSLTFPTTHLLALDAAVLRETCRKYRVTPEVYRRTPRRLRQILAPLGIGDHNFPKSYLNLYDAFTLLWVLAVRDGHRLRVLTTPDEPDVVHIGGMSYDRDNPRLRYVHARFLALPTSAPLVDRYWPRLVGKGTTLEGLEAAAAGTPAAKHLHHVDAVMRRISSALAHIHD